MHSINPAAQALTASHVTLNDDDKWWEVKSLSYRTTNACIIKINGKNDMEWINEEYYLGSSFIQTDFEFDNKKENKGKTWPGYVCGVSDPLPAGINFYSISRSADR